MKRKKGKFLIFAVFFISFSVFFPGIPIKSPLEEVHGQVTQPISEREGLQVLLRGGCDGFCTPRHQLSWKPVGEARVIGALCGKCIAVLHSPLTPVSYTHLTLPTIYSV